MQLRGLDAAAVLLIGADAYQTASWRSWQYEREVDCIIGHHPSRASVAEFFAAAAVGHELAVSVAYRWHPWAAQMLDVVTIGWEGQTVLMNARIDF